VVKTHLRNLKFKIIASGGNATEVYYFVACYLETQIFSKLKNPMKKNYLTSVIILAEDRYAGS